MHQLKLAIGESAARAVWPWAALQAGGSRARVFGLAEAGRPHLKVQGAPLLLLLHHAQLAGRPTGSQSRNRGHASNLDLATGARTATTLLAARTPLRVKRGGRFGASNYS